MHTTCSLTIFLRGGSALLEGLPLGGLPSWGICPPGGLPSWRSACQGVCPPGGLPPGGLPKYVSRGVCLNTYLGRPPRGQTPPPPAVGQTDACENITFAHFATQVVIILHKFSSITKDGSDIDRFSNRKWVSTMCTFEICEYQSLS